MKRFVNSYSSVLFLTFYLLLVLYITLFSRSPSLTRSYELGLFWSYALWFKGSELLGSQILLNIALFVPLGFLITDAIQLVYKKKNGIIAVAICLFISAIIEAVQYYEGVGLCEVDDVFNNVVGSCTGACIYNLLILYCSEQRLLQRKVFLSLLFLTAGLIGCNIISQTASQRTYKAIMQYNFEINEVITHDKKLSLKGYCWVYDRDTPDYQIILKGNTTGTEYQAATRIKGNLFYATADVKTNEKFEVFVKFRNYPRMSTYTYINNNRVEFVSGVVPAPDVEGTDLKHIARNGMLKAYERNYDVYVYQYHNKLYWLIGTAIDKRTEIIFHLRTNEPYKLPAQRRQYKFDNLGFRAGANNEITRQIHSGKYRVFERDIPEEYNITAVMVGYNTDKKIQWTRWFRLSP